MILHKHGGNTIILKEDVKKIDVQLFNDLINKLLKKRNELDKNSTIKRVSRHLNYVIVCGYASLVFENLEEFVEIFLNEFDIQYVKDEIPSTELNKIQEFLPLINIRGNSQCGGTNDDSRMIDPNVKILCDVINKFDGIKTFSSCDGHPIKNNEPGTFYLLFTHDTKENLTKITLALWNGLEKVFKKYPNCPPINLFFDYGHWPHMKEVYFELRTVYEEKQQQLVFDAMNDLSEFLKQEL